MIPYKPRRIASLEPVEQNGWQLKRYSVAHQNQTYDPTRFHEGRGAALGVLPMPAVTPERTGVGFLIEHQGNAIDYVVLGWWDRENELPLRTFVCEPPVTGTWRTAHGSESVCVWDLQIIWNERQAYVETVLAEHPVDAVRNYMNRTADCVEAAGD